MDISVILLPALLAVILIIIIIFLSSSKPRQKYGVESVTLRGENVKSIGERKIADYFERRNIRYVYEQRVRGISVPDFYLPDYGVYVEYWGLNS